MGGAGWRQLGGATGQLDGPGSHRASRPICAPATTQHTIGSKLGVREEAGPKQVQRGPCRHPRALQALARFLESQQASPASLSLTAREQWPVGPSSWPLAASARLGLLGAPSQDCCLLHWMDSAQQTMPRTEPRKLPRCSRGWLCALILSGSDTISQGCAALPAPRHLAGPGQWPSVSRNI